MSSLDDASLRIKVHLSPRAKPLFLNWQSVFRSQVSKAEGFKSLEILSPSSEDEEWSLNLRFISPKSLEAWYKSAASEQLLRELIDRSIADRPYVISKKSLPYYQNGVTEVFVTLVHQDKLAEFHEWHEKIHKMEAMFPGFQKIYIQAPDPEKKEEAWITLLQFDTPANLDRWHNSKERAEILKGSQDFIASKETHRLLSSIGGLFDDRLPRAVPVWKQSMMILAVLYPLVVFQDLYLAPHLSSITVAVRAFIQNVITVILLAWPMLPLAIYGLKWWLELKGNLLKQFAGVGVLLLVYLLEVALFWKLSVVHFF